MYLLHFQYPFNHTANSLAYSWLLPGPPHEFAAHLHQWYVRPSRIAMITDFVVSSWPHYDESYPFLKMEFSWVCSCSLICPFAQEGAHFLFTHRHTQGHAECLAKSKQRKTVKDSEIAVVLLSQCHIVTPNCSFTSSNVVIDLMALAIFEPNQSGLGIFYRLKWRLRKHISACLVSMPDSRIQKVSSASASSAETEVNLLRSCQSVAI